MSTSQLNTVKRQAFRAGQTGFTILELIVALVILGLGAMFLTRSVSESSLQAKNLRYMMDTISVGDYLVAQAEANPSAFAGIHSGKTGQIEYVTQCNRVERAADDNSDALAAYEISIVLSWTAEGVARRATWRTFVLARA